MRVPIPVRHPVFGDVLRRRLAHGDARIEMHGVRPVVVLGIELLRAQTAFGGKCPVELRREFLDERRVAAAQFDVMPQVVEKVCHQSLVVLELREFERLFAFFVDAAHHLRQRVQLRRDGQ